MQSMINLFDPNTEQPDLTLNVRFMDGTRFKGGALAGLHLVELLRAHGLPVKAECGGAGACATCHVRIPEAWQHLLPPPSDEELAKLDEIPTADDASRLACQITMTDTLDGLELELQSDSQLAPSALHTRAA